MNTPQPVVPATPMAPIPGVAVTASGTLFNPATRLAWLLWAPSGYGKTTLAGQLDELTQKYEGKRTLYIACESADGGGAATIRGLDVPLCTPKSYEELDKITRWLRNDKTIGGVVVDSATEVYKQYIKATTLKYPCRENVATRAAGVLTRSDYQVAGELTSQLFRNLMMLTTLTDPTYRKHLIITAADQTREEDEKITWVGPDLPGRMSREAVQMFQQVGTIGIESKVIDGKRQALRYITFATDGVKALKDRFNVFPDRITLASPGVKGGETLVSMYEKYWLAGLAPATAAKEPVQ